MRLIALSWLDDERALFGPDIATLDRRVGTDDPALPGGSQSTAFPAASVLPPNEAVPTWKFSLTLYTSIPATGSAVSSPTSETTIRLILGKVISRSPVFASCAKQCGQPPRGCCR